MNNIYLKICNEDRVGLVFDVSHILTKQNINILSMEVQPNIIYLEIQSLDSLQEIDLSSQLKTIPHVQDVEQLPYSIKCSLLGKQQQIDDSGFESITHSNEQMKNQIKLAKRAAKSDSSILLRGESGTGKELFAKAIHHSSSRHNMPFVPVNCAALPDALLESELFGYENGAFTGAQKYGKKGLFEHADGGTLFLDEIGELPLHLQSKLLRVLQEGTIRRIGGNQEIAINVRIISATHCDLESMISQKLFREDLYYRLNVIPLVLPPLRDRKDELPLLIAHILQKKYDKLSQRQSQTPQAQKMITKSAIEKLLQHEWPGNIRELENVIERAICFSSDLIISSDDIFLDNDLIKKQQINIQQITHKPVEYNKKLKDSLNELEYEILFQAIKKYGTSRQIGKVLGISHTGVLNRMRKYQLHQHMDCFLE